MIRAYIPVHFFQFLRESTEKPGDGTTIVAFDDDATPRWWFVLNSCVDGIEYYPPAPAHRLIDPLSIQPGQRSRDYAGIQHVHKRIKLDKPPAKLLSALESARKKQNPTIIRQRWQPAVWLGLKRRGLRLWRSLLKRVTQCKSKQAD